MFLRTFNIAFLLSVALAACSNDGEAGQSAGNDAASAEKAQANANGEGASKSDAIDCALDGATAPQAVCKRTIVQNGDVTQLVLEGPEGDFRRFNILTDGRGLEAADGAEPATITLIEGGKIEVKVADDIYILPATVKDTASAPAPNANATPAAPVPAAAPPQ